MFTHDDRACRIKGANGACREYVERHLERSFYDHAALTPADWSTYCQLASLAQERFGLHVPAPALPEHRLTEGAPISRSAALSHNQGASETVKQHECLWKDASLTVHSFS